MNPVTLSVSNGGPVNGCKQLIRSEMTFVAEDIFHRISHKGKQSISILLVLLMATILSALKPAVAEENKTAATSDSTSSNHAPTGADASAVLFSQRCGGCHTVGKGALVGPDLKAVNSWNISELEATVKRMESFAGPLKAEEVKALVEFLHDPQNQERVKVEDARAVAATAESMPSSPEVGQQLFIGKQALVNGGISCISCHQVEGHGGTMGKDLTDAYEKLGKAALISTCEQPAYPVMKAIYREHPITRQEALHITKYLSSLKGGTGARPDWPFALIGSGCAALLLVAIMFSYRGRNRGARSRLQRK